MLPYPSKVNKVEKIIIVPASPASIINVYWPVRVLYSPQCCNSTSVLSLMTGGELVLQALGPAATSSVKNTCKLELSYIRDPILIICTRGI